MFTVKANSMFWPNVNALVEFLRPKEIGTVVKYPEVNGGIGTQDIRVNERRILDKAREILAEEQLFFEVINGVGIVRITNENRNQIYGIKGLKSINRKLKKEAKTAANINYSSLSDQGKHSWNVASTVYSFMKNVLKPDTAKQIDAKCRESNNRILTLEEMQKLFS